MMEGRCYCIFFIANGNPVKTKIEGWLIKSNVQELSADKQK